MSAVEKLQDIQEKNKSYICLGLDLDPKKMPPDSTKSIKGMYEFAMNIINATKDQVCAYKPNMAFYENLGHDGISLLESIVSRMPSDIPIILDGKRGDIGNTASFYAEAMYEKLRADWVTLSPYMGYDSMRPFLEYDDKGIFVLCLTSNTGSKDFQLLDVNGKPLYQVVAEKVDYWNKADNCGLVVGATNPEQLKELRTIAKNMPLLIPGVGAQGGSLEKALIYGTDEFKKPAVINVSRSVLYASNGTDYAERARAELIKLNEMTKKIKAGEYTEESSQPVPTDENQQQEEKEQHNNQNEQSKKQFSGYNTQSHHTPKPEPDNQPPEQPKEDAALKSETPPKSEPPSASTSSAIAATASLSNAPQPEKTPEAAAQEQPVAEFQPVQAQSPSQPEPPQQETKPAENKPEPPQEQSAQSSQQNEKPQETKQPEQQEKKFTPPPLPTPPPPLQPNPEVIKRNREEFERRQKLQREQRERQNNGQTDNKQNQSNGQNQQSENRHNQNNHRNSGQNNSYKQQNNNRQFNGNRDSRQNNNERRENGSNQNQNPNPNQNQNEHQRPNINKPWENK